jgi:hypothetical protein
MAGIGAGVFKDSRGQKRYNKAKAAENKANRQWGRAGSNLGSMAGAGRGLIGRGWGMMDTGYRTAKDMLGNLQEQIDPAAARQRAVNEAAVNAEIAGKTARGTLERNLTGTGGIKLGSGRAIGAMKDLEMRTAAMKAGEMNRAARAAQADSTRDQMGLLDAAARMSGQGVQAASSGMHGLGGAAQGQQGLGSRWDNRATEEADTAGMLDPNLNVPRPQGVVEETPVPGQAPASTPAAAPKGAIGQQVQPKNMINGQPAEDVVGKSAPGKIEMSGTAPDGAKVVSSNAQPATNYMEMPEGQREIPQDPAQQDELLTQAGWDPTKMSPAEREAALLKWKMTATKQVASTENNVNSPNYSLF